MNLAPSVKDSSKADDDLARVSGMAKEAALLAGVCDAEPFMRR